MFLLPITQPSNVIKHLKQFIMLLMMKIRELTEDEIASWHGLVHYITMFAVVKPDSISTKTRVISNSALNSVPKLLLNDCMWPGPNVMYNLLQSPLGKLCCWALWSCWAQEWLSPLHKKTGLVHADVWTSWDGQPSINKWEDFTPAPLWSQSHHQFGQGSRVSGSAPCWSPWRLPFPVPPDLSLPKENPDWMALWCIDNGHMHHHLCTLMGLARSDYVTATNGEVSGSTTPWNDDSMVGVSIIDNSSPTMCLIYVK